MGRAACADICWVSLPPRGEPPEALHCVFGLVAESSGSAGILYGPRTS